MQPYSLYEVQTLRHLYLSANKLCYILLYLILILMDIQMKFMDGYTATKALGRHAKWLTGNDRQGKPKGTALAGF